MKRSAEEFLKGCEHDGSFIPVNEVIRLMEAYANQQNEFPMCTVCNEIKCECADQQKELRCKDDIVIKKIIFPK